jgi:hypothetical protein
MATSFSGGSTREFPERTTDHGQATGKFYPLRLRVECTLFCNLPSRVRTHAVLVIGLYELLGNPTTYVIEPPGISEISVIQVISEIMAIHVISEIFVIHVISEIYFNKTLLY